MVKSIDPHGATKAGEGFTGHFAGQNMPGVTESLPGTLGSPFQSGGTMLRAPSHLAMSTMAGMMEGVGVPGQPLLMNGMYQRKTNVTLQLTYISRSGVTATISAGRGGNKPCGVRQPHTSLRWGVICQSGLSTSH
ncbi:MAG TPA: hypothetical protein VGO47_10230 [Chlamydiales bacterium]|nr:hypothetical protein [Chlamydiales bacterium]